MKFQDTLNNFEQNLIKMKVPENPLDDEDVEIIPPFPYSEVVKDQGNSSTGNFLQPSAPS